MDYKHAAVDRSLQMYLDNDSAFLQWVADNVDHNHNQVTLTGKDYINNTTGAFATSKAF